jgi:diphthamide synthase subunit DPH2
MISNFSLDAKMKLPLEFLKRKDKQYYLFAFDTLDHKSLEDFTFIDSWINFACNRIMDDRNNKIVNVQDILEAERES